MEADIHAFHVPDFLCNCVIVGLRGSIKHSEAHLNDPFWSLPLKGGIYALSPVRAARSAAPSA